MAHEQDINQQIEQNRPEAARIIARTGRLDQDELDEMVFDAIGDTSAAAMNEGGDHSEIDDGEDMASRINNRGQEDQVAALLALGVDAALIIETCTENAAPGKYVVSDQDEHPGSGWGHIFTEGSREVERDTRFVYDRETETLVSADIKRGNKWHQANRDEMADLEESLKEANAEFLDNPGDHRLVETDDLPEWAQPSPEGPSM